MTQTLTTEMLRALRDSLKSWQDGYDPVDDKEQYEMFVTAETAVGELLANREAQPVGFYTTVSGRKGVVWHNGAPDDDTAIYTAPPAPARVKLPTEFCSDEGIVVRLEEVMAALALVGVKYERKGGACRAAMLAQPVSQGYKLADGWIACNDRLPDTDGNYWGWWSENKRQGPVWFIKSDVQAQFQSSEITHWMPLPAAPEGGNDPDTRR